MIYLANKFKIRSFEAFIISINLKTGTNLNLFKNNLISELKKESSFDQPNQQLNLVPQTEFIGIIEDVSIKLNYSTNIINLEGQNPEKTLIVLDKLLAALKQIDYDPKFTINFYDLNAILTGKKDGSNPMEIIGNSFKFPNIEGFEKYEPKFLGILLNNYIEATDNYLNLNIQPRFTNPTEIYYVGLSYRATKLDELIEFNGNLESNLEKLIDSLEEKNDR